MDILIKVHHTLQINSYNIAMENEKRERKEKQHSHQVNSYAKKKRDNVPCVYSEITMKLAGVGIRNI